MTSKERENFLRNAILLVDHSKAALVSLVELNVQNNGQTFEQFVNTNQHEIYHLYNSSMCCKCPPGHYPPRSPRILHQPQMELLFDLSSIKSTCHKPVRRSDDFCCCMAWSGLSTDVLDLTLARCLLVNFCNDVFWFSCLQFQSITLEDFLNHNKHNLYHLWKYNAHCCQCPTGYTFPTNYSVLNQNDWIKMFNANRMPCTNHRKRPSSGCMQCIFSFEAASGITIMKLDPFVCRIILQHCCRLRIAIEALVQIRNQEYGHAKEGIMSDNDYNTSISKIERCILDIAKVCNKEPQFKQKLREAKYGALDQSLFTQYQNYLLETLTRQTDIHQSVADLPKLMNEYVKKGYEYHEQLMERFNQTLVKVKNQTHMEIDCHVTEGTFVGTNAIRKFIEWMHMKDVFVIIGSKGSGKSRNGLEILRLFGQTNENFDLLKVTDFQQVKDIITDERETVVLLDDVLSAKECSCKSLINHHILDLLNARKCKGHVKIIFTIDSSKLKSFNDLLASHRLFQNCCKIDLNSARFCMSEGEKETLLLNFCKQQNICIISDSCSTSEDFYLDGRAVYEIAKTDPYIGYPKSCFEFTANKKFLQLGINFFKHTNQSLIAEINSLRYSNNINREHDISYALLIYIMLDSGILDINKLDITKLETIMDASGYYQQKRFLINKVVKSAERMSGRFLTQDSQTMFYHFKHPMIYEALAISYFEDNPAAVISVLNINFIIDLIRLERDDFGKHQTSLVIGKEMFGNLAKRILVIFEKDYKTKSAGFMKMLCDSSIILQNNPDFIGLLIREFNNCTSQDTIEIHIEGGREQMPFHFSKSLIWFLIQKNNVDKSISTVLHFIEDDIKDDKNLEKVKASEKVILACFYYLCETYNSDMKLEHIYGMIKKYGMECSYDCGMQMAFANNNDPVVSFLLSHVSREIDISKLVLEVENVEDIRRLWDLISKNLSIACIITDNKTDILNCLFMSLPFTFNLNKSIKTACQWIIEDTYSQIHTSSKSNFQSLKILLLIYEQFPAFQIDVISTVLTKINDKIANSEEILQCLYMNIKTIFCPITTFFNFSCKNSLTKVVKWILQNYDHSIFNIHDLIVETCKGCHYKTAEVIISEIDLNKVDVTSVTTSMFQTCQNNISKDFVLFLLKNIDQKYCRWMDIISIIVDLELYDYIKLMLQHLDISKNDMMKIIRNKMNVLSENKLNDLLQSIKKELLDLNYIVLNALQSGYQRIVAWSIRNDNQNAINKSLLLDEAVIRGNENVKHHLLKNFDYELLQIAFRKGKVGTVKLLLMNVDEVEFDVKTAIDNVFSGITINTVKSVSDNDNVFDTNADCERTEIVRILLEIFDHELFDMTTVINTAFENRWYDLIHLVIEKVNDSLLDLTDLLNMACQSERVDIVRLVTGKIGNSNIDIEAVMRRMLFHGSFKGIRLLMSNANISLLDFGTDMIDACCCGRSELVMRLIESDQDNIDVNCLIKLACNKNCLDIIKCIAKNEDISIINSTLKEACRLRRIEIVNWLVQNNKNISSNCSGIINDACTDINLGVIETLLPYADHTLLEINKIFDIACESDNLELVKWLIENVDKTLIDMTGAMIDACTWGKLDIVKWLIENVDNELLDIKEAMNDACTWGKFEIAEWLIENVDYKIFNMEHVLNKACCLGGICLLECLRQYIALNLFDVNESMIAACNSGQFDVMKWFIENFGNKLYDMKQAMNNACILGNLGTVEWLIKNVNIKLFNMTEAMHDVCISGNNDIIKWLIENVDIELFDMKGAMIKTCAGGNNDIVKWFIENVDNKLFDIKEGMIKACAAENFDIVTWLIENIDKFDPKFLNLQSALYIIYDILQNAETVCFKNKLEKLVLLICKKGQNKKVIWTEVLNTACAFGFKEVVKWLVTYFPSKTFDFNTAIQNATEQESNRKCIIRTILRKNSNRATDIRFVINLICHYGYTDIALWLFQKQRIVVFDSQNVMNEACLHGDLSFVKYLWEKYNHNLFDMNSAIINACRCEKGVNTIKWLWKNADHQLFDMNIVMNNACRYGREKVIEWILQNVDKSKFSINEAFNNACTNEQQGVVKLMIENMPKELLQIPHALHTACLKNTKDGIFKMLLQHTKNTSLNIDLIIREACKHGNIVILQYLLNTAYVRMIDRKQAMTAILSIDINNDSYTDKEKLFKVKEKEQMAVTIAQKSTLFMLNIDELIKEIFKNGWLELLQLIWSNEDHRIVDIDQSKIETACKYGRASIVYWAVCNLDLYKINVKALMTKSCGFGWLEIVKIIWIKEKKDKFDMKSAMNEGCSYGRHEVVTWLIQNTDNNLFDMNVVMEISCRNTWIDIIKNILPLDLSACNVTVAITAACTTGNVELVQLLLNRFGKENIDYDQISKSVVTSSENAYLAICLLHTFDFDMFDIPNIFSAACGFGWLNVIKYIKHRSSTNLYVGDGMIKACIKGEDKIVTYLLEEFPHDWFDFRSSFLAASKKGLDEIVTIILDKVDHTKLDIKNSFLTICFSGEADIVSIILKKVDHNLLDLNETAQILNKDKKYEQVVVRIVKDTDNTRWDKQSLIEKAREHTWWKVLAYLSM